MKKKLFILVLALVSSIIFASTAFAFQDVADTSTFYNPVTWAVKKGITKGVTTNSFEPKTTCTHNHILTFIWRSQGSPSATGSTDFEKATNWAISKGIVSSGVNGNAVCTRAEAVTYLWKLEGSPTADITVSFSDIALTDSYVTAVAWALDKGITNGTSALKFSPNEVCTRGQIVTFLYRNVNLSHVYEAYANYLRSSVPSYATGFYLANIDGDGVPELVTPNGDSHPSLVTVYTYYDGSVQKVDDFGSFGALRYAPNQNMIDSAYSQSGGQTNNYYSLVGKTSKLQLSLFQYTDYTGSTTVYTVNDVKVSADVYKQQSIKMASNYNFVEIKAGNAFEINSTNINNLVANPQLYYRESTIG